jgi:SapC
MPAKLLLYETVVPLSVAQHSDCWVEVGDNYDFSDKVNSVPLMAVEFPPAAAEYAIVFAGDPNPMPAVILGVRGNENLFLSKDKAWAARYIPAFVRRYPFVFSTSPDGQQLALCIDEAFAGFNREGRGQRLFTDEGKPSAYVEGVLKFLQDFQAQYRRTQAFCAKLQQFDILEPMRAQVELASGERLALGGFRAISRAKLKALPAETLAGLAQTDELELLYLQLQSMRNFLGLGDRLAVSEGEKNAAASGGGDAARPTGGNGSAQPTTE